MICGGIWKNNDMKVGMCMESCIDYRGLGAVGDRYINFFVDVQADALRWIDITKLNYKKRSFFRKRCTDKSPIHRWLAGWGWPFKRDVRHV